MNIRAAVVASLADLPAWGRGSDIVDCPGGSPVRVLECALGRDADLCCDATNGVVFGRRPLGHVERSVIGTDRLGRDCAVLAHLGAAALIAFEELAIRLVSIGAPTALVRRCHGAAADQRLHVRLLAGVAHRRGVSVPDPKNQKVPASLFEVALDNAAEGCAGDTWAALVAWARSERAQTTELRRIFRRIATDKTRHGQLAWDLDAWLMPRLSVRQRAEVDAARNGALRELQYLIRAEMVTAPELGTLPKEQWRHLAGSLRHRLLDGAVATAA